MSETIERKREGIMNIDMDSISRVLIGNRWVYVNFFEIGEMNLGVFRPNAEGEPYFMGGYSVREKWVHINDSNGDDVYFPLNRLQGLV